MRMARTVVPNPRREPVRTCVACRAEAGKRAMVRVVGRPEGAMIDRTGHAVGRGAYLHADPQCVATARKRKALERALKTPVSPEVWAELGGPTSARPAP
jgi:predicted RNA-binding protein YlxR (DUF448 family)